MRVLAGARRLRDELLDQPSHTLLLRLTAMVFLLRGVSKESAFLAGDALLDVICLGMLLSPVLLESRALWFALTAVIGAAVAGDWPKTDNHMYLLGYLCLACALSLCASDRRESLARSAAALLGLAFLLATVWKVALGEWFDGSFLHGEILLEPRLALIKQTVGGFTAEDLERNRRLIGSVITYPESDFSVPLFSTPALLWFARVSSWLFLALEAFLAVAYLFAPRRLLLVREPMLVAFAFALYVLMPIDRFGFALALLGLACCPLERRTMRTIFLLAIPFLRFVPPLSVVLRAWLVAT